MSFFFNATPTTEIYTLSLHDALPISRKMADVGTRELAAFQGSLYIAPESASLLTVNAGRLWFFDNSFDEDRKSTRLNSSHSQISYAVFCLKKKKKKKQNYEITSLTQF